MCFEDKKTPGDQGPQAFPKYIRWKFGVLNIVKKLPFSIVVLDADAMKWYFVSHADFTFFDVSVLFLCGGGC
nr:hypothetical protein HAGR004_20830 [Bdellovibrio sp. HAGR004]